MTEKIFQPVDDAALLEALNSLSRSINIVSTYGNRHPAFRQAVASAQAALALMFNQRKKVILGAFNGVMTIDDASVSVSGTLMKSLERRLAKLRITGLRLDRGISEPEIIKLCELMACNEADAFTVGMAGAGLTNISSENTSFRAVRAGQTVANEGDLASAGDHGILVINEEGSGGNGTGSEASVHVEQIVAFLKGDIEANEGGVAEELAKLASDPDRLGRMIMESVAIRQAACELSGESLCDVVLGCLRRTYDGLRRQPAFQTAQGVADLKKALLLLEESILDKMRNLAGESDPELDREIVQAIREMDENLGFELAANQYLEHRQAIEQNKQQLQSYVRAKGAEAAAELISNTSFPSSDWRRILVESHPPATGGPVPQIASNLNTLAMVFEKLEGLMKADQRDSTQVKHLLGQASENLDDTLGATREKLESLSRQISSSDEEDTGTIGGHANAMNRKDLLSSIAEIAQELMQPLTAISASLEMMLCGYTGEVNPEQRNMLDLASNSSSHLSFLMNELIAIVGCPANKGVDDRFHTTSEQVVQMEQR